MNKILVISDIHANLEALQAVLDDAGSVDAIWCLGDLVGYGPDPNECVSIISKLPNLVCLLGNHDAAVLGDIDIEYFNRDAGVAAKWTRDNLSAENLEFLRSLPERVNLEQVTLAHGSPRNPVWEYLLDIYTAKENFAFFDTQICLVGHSHIPLAYTEIDVNQKLALRQLQQGEILLIAERIILNPGSVGQPRDYDPRAAYAFFFSEENIWECRRVSYDIVSVQQKITQAGLPARHAERLTLGW